MARHRAPRPSVVRPLAGAMGRGMRWAAPRVLRGTGVAAGTVARGTRRAAVLGARGGWQGIKVAAMLALAATWVGLLLVLLAISAVVPQGAELRRGITASMLTPLGEGARAALGMGTPAPAPEAAPAVPRHRRQPSTLARDIDPDDDDLWPASDNSWGMRAARGLQSRQAA